MRHPLSRLLGSFAERLRVGRFPEGIHQPDAAIAHLLADLPQDRVVAAEQRIARTLPASGGVAQLPPERRAVQLPDQIPDPLLSGGDIGGAHRAGPILTLPTPDWSPGN